MASQIHRMLLISEIFPPRIGGSGRWFWEIYRRIGRESAIIAAGECDGQVEFDRTHELQLYRVLLTFPNWGLLKWRGATNYVRAFRRLRSIVKQHNIEQVHAGRCLPEGLLALMLKKWLRVPYLCYAHGEELNYARLSRELNWLMKRVFANADRVICNSQNTKNILSAEWRMPEEKLTVLHPGVDTQRFRPAERSLQVRAHLDWNQRFVILTVGRLQKRKGHDMLIRALPEIRKYRPNVLYAIVGTGDEESSLKSMVASLGLEDNVRFHGDLSDEKLRDCYQQCDLFVLPNRQVAQDFEGFGMVLVEAQACGRPVVAGNSGGTAETMVCGVTGEIIDCSQTTEIANAIIKLAASPDRLSTMGKAARQWTIGRFDWAVLSQKANGLFDSQSENERQQDVPRPDFGVLASMANGT